jgi:hypothetical protein
VRADGAEVPHLETDGESRNVLLFKELIFPGLHMLYRVGTLAALRVPTCQDQSGLAHLFGCLRNLIFEIGTSARTIRNIARRL